MQSIEVVAPSAAPHQIATDVVIVGAGPYGLSLAAHLRDRGVPHRIYGKPMTTWTQQMPAGMHLKSEGFASTLYDPGATFALRDYCREREIPYRDIGLPVPLDVFAQYGREFAKRFVPDLDERNVVGIMPLDDGFEVRLADGERIAAKRVIVAVGISHFAYTPPEFAHLPASALSHTAEHHDLSSFAGKRVAVIGAGASAMDVAAILHARGADTHIVARIPKLQYLDPPDMGPRSFIQRLRWPVTGIGTGWKAKFFEDLPHVFHRLPESMRLSIVKKKYAAIACWFTRALIEGKVREHLGVTVERTSVGPDGVTLTLQKERGENSTLVVDHVIAGTGYRVDLDRLAFLPKTMRSRIRTAEGSPILSQHFESSVPNLYFLGLASANSFGPMLRFACGAGYAARRLTKALAASRT